MNFIAKYLNAIGLVLLLGFATATAAVYLDVPAKLQSKPAIVVPRPAPSLAPKPVAVSAPVTPAGCAHEESTGGGCCGSDGAAPMPAGCPHHNPTK